MFVKLIDENTIEVAPNVLFDDKKVYANPTEETLLRFGYLPFLDSEHPEEEGYYFTFHYESDGEKVFKAWDKHEIIIETPAENMSEDEESAPENVQDEENEQEITEPMESENESQE